MTTLHFAASTRSAARAVPCFGQKAPVSVRRVLAVAASQQEAPTVSRRETFGTAFAALAAASLVLQAEPAHALFGVGEDTDTVIAAYTENTTKVLGLVNDMLAAPKGDPTREDKVKALRSEINSWVAKYRREGKVAGRPSFGNTYSALNALAGHFNSFGADAPIPKKRLERLTKEVSDATLYLTRGR